MLPQMTGKRWLNLYTFNWKEKSSAARNVAYKKRNTQNGTADFFFDQIGAHKEKIIANIFWQHVN